MEKLPQKSNQSSRLATRHKTVTGSWLKELEGASGSLAKAKPWACETWLLIDTSGSMGSEGIKQACSGAFAFAAQATASGYKVGVINFASDCIIRCEPTRSADEVRNSLQLCDASGGTDMTNAIALAAQKLSGRDGLRSICIVTDGVPNDEQSAIRAAKATAAEGVEIITIGVEGANEAFLRLIATKAELSKPVKKTELAASMRKAAGLLPPPR
jgi:Mg-chelatase subunit ChlD